jgi:hypothetical protein
VWRALLVAFSLSLATSARADTTWIDGGIDRLGALTFAVLNDQQDYEGMFELANSLVKEPAFFAGKPLLADIVGRLVMYRWTRNEDAYEQPFTPERYRRRATAMLQIAAIHPSFGDEPLVYALDSLYDIRDLGPAYAAMRQLETEYPLSQRARWTTRRRVDLHARHGEFKDAARIAKELILTARRPEQREAFYIASDAMPLWIGLGDMDTAMRMLAWMDAVQQRDDISNGAMYMMDAVRLVDDHRLER